MRKRLKTSFIVLIFLSAKINFGDSIKLAMRPESLICKWPRIEEKYFYEESHCSSLISDCVLKVLQNNMRDIYYYNNISIVLKPNELLVNLKIPANRHNLITTQYRTNQKQSKHFSSISTNHDSTYYTAAFDLLTKHKVKTGISNALKSDYNSFKIKFIGWNSNKCNINKFKNIFGREIISTLEDLTFKTSTACDAAMPRKVVTEIIKRNSGNLFNITTKIQNIECTQKYNEKVVFNTENKKDNINKHGNTQLNAHPTNKESMCNIVCENVSREMWRKNWGSKKIIFERLSLKEIRKTVRVLFPHHDSFKRRIMPVKAEDVPEITDEELLRAYNAINVNKSAGPDQIPPLIVKLVVSINPKNIKNIIYKTFISGGIPIPWKTSKLILLSKKNKLRRDSTAYRPICIQNSYNNLLERFIYFRIISLLPSHGGLVETQYGYRKGQSKWDAVRKIFSIATQTHKKKICALITLDVRNAFNEASWEVILEAIRKRNFPAYIYNMINSLLQERRIILKDWKGNTDIFNVSSGIPQGSILSATLWNILFDDVLKINLGHEVHLIAYADDLAMIIKAHDNYDLVEKTNSALDKISSWLKLKKLRLAPEKTKAVILSEKQEGPIIFNIEGVTIEPEDKLKYLGVWFDQNFTSKQVVV